MLTRSARLLWLLPIFFGLLLAVLLPAQGAGSVGAVVCAAAAGIAVGRFGPAVTWPAASARWWVFIGGVLLVALGASVFSVELTESPDWRVGDWAIQRAVLAKLMPHVPGFGFPTWMHEVSTGDAPLETYPALAYVVTAHVAWLADLRADLPRAMMIVAVAVHVGLAVQTMRITVRVAPLPAAVLIGVVALLDVGDLSGGGVSSLFRWGLFHHAFAQVLVLWAAVAVLDALRTPSQGTALRIWAAVAIATAAHPSALLQAGLMIVGLGAVALLARDVPPRRALFAMLHLAAGIGLGALVWMPMGQRLLAYGQHFSTAFRSANQIFQSLIAGPVPSSSFAAVMMLGVLGLVLAFWSRRSAPVFVATVGLLAIVLLSDRVYNAFELAPSPTTVRLGIERFSSMARPFVLAAAGYALAMCWAAARRHWRDALGWQGVVAHAVVGVLVLGVGRMVLITIGDKAGRAADEARVLAPDATSREELIAWARTEMAKIPAGKMARVLVDADDQHYEFNLVADAGMPVVHLGAIPNLLLRNRINDSSEASLQRFNIRWVIARGKAPSAGDPATERAVGRYRIRDVAGWDGDMARVTDQAAAAGARVRTLAVHDNGVDVEVTAGPAGAVTAPVLVILGTGYYPRWQVVDASGKRTKTIEVPAVEGGRAGVVAAWLPPGIAHFTVDGPLRSDRAGWPVAGLSLLGIIAGLLVWRTRWRWRLLYKYVRARKAVAARPALLHTLGASTLTLLLVSIGLRDCVRAEPALLVGTGVRASATVTARVGEGPWQTCGYRPALGQYECTDIVTVNDGVTALLYDDAASWRYPTPGIRVMAQQYGITVRVEMQRRIHGRYWGAATDDRGNIRVGDQAFGLAHQFAADFTHASLATVTVEVTDPPLDGWFMTLVREDALAPARAAVPMPITPN
ncbi:MAG: hypothetical protein KBG15_07965 [Kofleriaceae bacterium]|nr:hypothetical protein [Kofleriaceae bacterium]